ncbi:MAG TPA: WG repeat-containing protein, partial [Catalimonadaceae bacterium]|nr:WG repeat-containing protein [Catalimonadaceae bacterium]
MPAQNIFRFLQLLLAFQIGWQYSSFGQSYDCEEELFSKKDKQTRLFGYVNAIGEYRIPPSFLKAMPFVGRNAVVQQGKRFGVINCEGILVVPADYEEIASFSNGKGWVKKGGLWGLADLKGR